MKKKSEYYFKNDREWRKWLHKNHRNVTGVDLIFYKLENSEESMRWEEAVRVALCYGWIDSTVKSLGEGKRKQYFCPRKARSVWSKVNKTHIEELLEAGLMHSSGLETIAAAKKNGSWTALDDVENGIIPDDLKKAFTVNKKAFKNFQHFTRGQKKSYLYWLNMAKRETTRKKRVEEIIKFCRANIQTRT